MTQISYRANLTSSAFPLLSFLQGRNVIVSGPDQNFSRQVNSNKDKDRDIGIPQAYYGHNIFPIDAGIETVAYTQIATAPADTDNKFIAVFTIRDPDENIAYLAITSSGRCYVLSSLSGWVRTTDAMPSAGNIVTVAHVNGNTYIYFGQLGCFKYDFVSNTLKGVTLVGLDTSKILGIVAASGYLIAWTATSVAWSSTVDETDFVPSLVTGAGGGKVQKIRGSIVVCTTHPTGFIVYSTQNAVSFVYTQNSQYPFNDKDIVDSGGILSLSLAVYDSNNSNQFAYTTAGLQTVNSQQAKIIFPEVTDFLEGLVFEDFDEITTAFNVTYLSVPVVRKITLVSNRYLIISYGVTSYTHALVYDMGLGRWGKFKINHVDCFEYSVLSSTPTENPRSSIAFLQQNGTIKVAVMSYNTDNSSGVLLLGKYQYDRNEYLTLLEVHLEATKVNNTLTVSALSSINGQTMTTNTLSASINLSNYRRYNCRYSGLNHSILMVGAFQASCLVLKFTPAGQVR